MSKLIRLFVFFSLTLHKVHRVIVPDGVSLDIAMPIGSGFVQNFMWISLSRGPLNLNLQEGFC